MKRALKWSGIALALLLLAGVAAPFIGADRYKEQIRVGLERALQRKVDIYGDIRLNLFRGPGFSVEQVVIHEDPAIGIEPFASVPELQAQVSFSSLWTGRLGFSTVRFVGPSLNVARPEGGTWNVVPLLAGSAMASGKGAQFPEIQVSDGRINFKLGDLKSAFYLTDTDLTVSPGHDGFRIDFSGAPARTDRSGGGYGLFTGRGRWADGRLDMDVELEPSPIEDFLTLARGHSLGLHGTIASRAKMSGPVSDLSLTGTIDVEDVHRWDLMEAHGGKLTFKYRGKFDLAAQRFHLSADPADNRGTPVSLRLAVSRILSRPDWRVEAIMDKMPAASLLTAARNIGTPLPTGLTVDGDVGGTLAYSEGFGVQGQVRIENAALTLQDGSKFRMPQASVMVDGDELRLLPAELEGKGHTAQLQGTYAPFRQAVSAKLVAQGMRLADLRRMGIRLPVAERFESGAWSGSVSYSSKAWDAKVRLKDATTRVPGLAAPVTLADADVEIVGDRLAVNRARLRMGETEAFGSYVYEPKAARPHRFDLTVPTADIAQVEQLLLPTLQRSGSFFVRTLRLRARIPEWLRERRAEGRVRIGALTAGDEKLRAVDARVIWSGTDVRLSRFKARLQGATIDGTVAVDLANAAPVYKLEGIVRQLTWKGGLVDIEGSAETSGTGLELLARLKVDGRFQARSLTMDPETAFGSATGAFDLALSRSGPQWKLTGLEVAMGAEKFNGHGGTQSDGKLAVDLESAVRTMSLKFDVAR